MPSHSYTCGGVIGEMARVWEGKETHGWRGPIIVWAVEKMGIAEYAWICVYAPVNARHGRRREEMGKF